MQGDSKYNNEIRTKTIKMWSKKLSKLSVFLIFVILVNIASGQTIVDSVTIDEKPQASNGDEVVAENSNLGNNNAIETTTIVEEGSGISAEVVVTTETTTESENISDDANNTETSTNAAASTEPVTESSTEQIECICDCIVNDNQVTLGCSTQSPQQKPTETTQNPETTTTSSTNDSTLPNDETTQPTDEEETTSQSNVEVDTTTQTTSEPQITTIAPPPICSNPGVQAHELDCKQYYDCSLEGSLDGDFHLLTKSCPGKQVFNIELNRCSRDISSCSLPVQCLVKGGISDPASNSSYYLCEPRLIGIGFRIFHIDCAANEIFYPKLRKCFVDFNNLPTQSFPPWNQLKDIDIVKAELKLLKVQDKLKLKQEKDRKKAEEKLQKQLEKEAKKKAKEEEKANKEKAKQEAATFVCLQEGNYASGISENIYYACINKKGKLRAIPMQCSFGTIFNPESGSCINSLTNVNISISEDEDDD